MSCWENYIKSFTNEPHFADTFVNGHETFYCFLEHCSLVFITEWLKACNDRQKKIPVRHTGNRARKWPVTGGYFMPSTSNQLGHLHWLKVFNIKLVIFLWIKETIKTNDWAITAVITHIWHFYGQILVLRGIMFINTN